VSWFYPRTPLLGLFSFFRPLSLLTQKKLGTVPHKALFHPRQVPRREPGGKTSPVFWDLCFQGHAFFLGIFPCEYSLQSPINALFRLPWGHPLFVPKFFLEGQPFPSPLFPGSYCFILRICLGKTFGQIKECFSGCFEFTPLRRFRPFSFSVNVGVPLFCATKINHHILFIMTPVFLGSSHGFTAFAPLLAHPLSFPLLYWGPRWVLPYSLKKTSVPPFFFFSTTPPLFFFQERSLPYSRAFSPNPTVESLFV